MDGVNHDQYQIAARLGAGRHGLDRRFGGDRPEWADARTRIFLREVLRGLKAGNNDCQTSTHSCAGTSTADNQGDAWIYLPAGACAKLTAGSLEPKA